MSDSPCQPSPPYALAFLTNEWEWREDLEAEDFDQAKAAARAALERVVREEKPELACVTLLEREVKVGIWDWVLERPYWTPL